jgi:hypothetical protein
MGHPEIKLHVQMEPRDYTAWSALIRRESRPGILRYGNMFLLAIALILAIIFYNLLVLAKLPPQAAGPISLGSVLILFGFVSRWIRGRFKPPMFDSKGAYLRPFEISVTEDDLWVRDAFNECRYAWRSFMRLEETHDYIYLFIDKMSAVIIPDRCFATESERFQFTAFVREALKANGISV